MHDFLRCAFVLVGILCGAGPLVGQPEIKPARNYEALAETLGAWIETEIAAKRIPALSLALVDDQEIVWSRGFGHADPAAKLPATAETIYRVGSISKPITCLLLMMFVELGLIDLDAPVQKYLPEFQPKNPHARAITLRQMVSHRSGLVRESPVGSYFDHTEPSLADTVKSLNQTELIFEPETTTAYSNAALTTVGYLLEKQHKEPFAGLIRSKLLQPLGMIGSSYGPTDEIAKKRARAIMWTYHGREFAAPTWELGMPPAGSLYASVNDMGKLIKFLHAGGRGPHRQLLKPETLEKMQQIQFGKKDDKSGFGLGFYVSEFEGRRRIGHGGAVYGFACDLAVLPHDKLGVIVCASKDVSNGLVQRVSAELLRAAIAVREGKPLPKIDVTAPVPPELGTRLAGRYQTKGKHIDLDYRDGKLWLWTSLGNYRLELRKLGDDLITDDVFGYGQKFVIQGDELRLDKTVYKRIPTPEPQPVPAQWQGLIGEYGPEHNVLYILEKDGQLQALIEWCFLYPLKEVSADVFSFPDYGLYKGDKVVFTRDAAGRGTRVVAANVTFERRTLRGEQGTFRIEPRQAVAELLKNAVKATPPKEENALFRKPDLVEVAGLDATIKLDIRYAGTNNFLGAPLYKSAQAYLQRPAAEAVLRVHKKLAAQGLGLLIFDAYRPWYVSKVFWDATPDEYRLFVADPQMGSRHNRGCAIDLTLYDLKTKQPIEMVSGYDEFSDRSYPDYLGGTSLQRKHRDLLRTAMESEGFTVYPVEWWHFDYRDWRHYPILNTEFAGAKKAEGSR